MKQEFRIVPLSETSVLVDFGNRIDVALNQRVLALAHYLEENPFPGFIEVVPAYSSLAVFYDLLLVRKQFSSFDSAFEGLAHFLAQQLNTLSVGTEIVSSRIVKVPVCYGEAFGLDWAEVCLHTGLTKAEIIARHTAATYRVFMMGFLPGFAYLGGMDASISVPRKPQPRTQLPAGSIGLAGRQTGVYPLQSPGGWQIIGRTPLKLFNKTATQPVLLKTGDEVRFYAITEAEFENYG